MTDGAVTGAYKPDLQQVIAALNEVLATLIVCILHHRNHYNMATGINAPTVAADRAHAEYVEGAPD